MSDNKKVKLIAIYMYISELYKKELHYTCQRFSNNSSPEFTDAELMTVYLFVVTEEERFQVKKSIVLPKIICFHGFQNYPPARHLIIGLTICPKRLNFWLYGCLLIVSLKIVIWEQV